MADLPLGSSSRASEYLVMYNSEEGPAILLTDRLAGAGLPMTLWRDAVSMETAVRALAKARCLMAIIGEKSWSVNQRAIVREAIRMKRPVIVVTVRPVRRDVDLALIANLPMRDLIEPTSQRIDELVKELLSLPDLDGEPGQVQQNALPDSRDHSDAGRVDRLLELLASGDYDQRVDAIDGISNLSASDRLELAGRLRREIGTDAGILGDSRFGRDDRQIARSWMRSCLIAVDAESFETQRLLLGQLGDGNDPHDDGRFWVVASLYRARVSYLTEALRLARGDAAPAVRELAEAIAHPDDPSLIDRFRKLLTERDYDRYAWPVLRALRIVPMPALAPDLARLVVSAPITRDTWHYDALFALSHPEVATAAAATIAEERVGDVVRTVLVALRDAHEYACTAFARFLRALDQGQVDRALADLRTNVVLGSTAARMAAALAKARRGTGGTNELSIAGYASDTIDPRFDRLGIARDVRTLTAVMLAEEVKPPLAIGLFGDWGSGKSFFMKSIKQEAEALAKRTRDAGGTRFCTELVHIEFNAWHYADTNLWASLVDYILEKLAQKVSPQPTFEQKQAEVLRELGSTKAIVKQAENDKSAIDDLIQTKQNDLEVLRVEREKKEIELRDLEYDDFKKLLADKDAAGLEAALKDLGVPKAIDNIKELAAVVAEVNTLRGQMTATVHSILSHGKPWRFWGLTGFVLFAIPVATAVANAVKGTEFITGAAAVAAEIGALMTALVAALRSGLAVVKGHLATVDKARARVEELLDAKRKTPSAAEVKLRAEIAGLATKEQEAAARLTAAAARVVELEEKIKALKEGYSLARFLAERRQSQDYQKHLGLISTIRKDFESLEERIRIAKQNDPEHRVDRIVLYIDDLDRCPEEKVLEVLQAVHLLLAFPLFVVVVGVDPRWLRHALARHHSALRDFDDDDVYEGKQYDRRIRADRRQSNDRRRDERPTPQNYLEKIFQIPFSLNPMTDTGFGDLVEGLLLSMPTRGQADSSSSGPASASPPAAPQPRTPPQSPGPPPVPGTPAQSPPPAPTLQQFAAPSFTITDEALNVSKWEGQFARRLFPLIPTPRSAKRLANVYRILKASVPRADLKTFEGSETVLGNFQVPMLLLAMIIKAPAECSQIFPALLKAIAEGRPALSRLQALAALAPAVEANGGMYRELADDIAPIVRDNAFPDDNAVFAKWIPEVSRFSFEIGGALQAPEVEPAPGAPSPGVAAPSDAPHQSRGKRSTAKSAK